MTRAGLSARAGLVAVLAAAVGVGLGAATEETPPREAVPAKPRKETIPETTEPRDVTPPPTLPDVDIPPIPEVDEDPFKPGALRKPGKGSPGLLAEGKRLFNREGRLETDKIGRSMFVFDSGETPMYLLENSWREFLEARTDYGAKLARWRVSGLVTVYGRRNYLLLTKCVRIEVEEDEL